MLAAIFERADGGLKRAAGRNAGELCAAPIWLGEAGINAADNSACATTYRLRQAHAAAHLGLLFMLPVAARSRATLQADRHDKRSNAYRRLVADL